MSNWGMITHYWRHLMITNRITEGKRKKRRWGNFSHGFRWNQQKIKEQLRLLRTSLNLFLSYIYMVLLRINRGFEVDVSLKILLSFKVTIMMISVCFSWAVWLCSCYISFSLADELPMMFTCWFRGIFVAVHTHLTTGARTLWKLLNSFSVDVI